LSGIKKQQIIQIEKLYKKKIPPTQIISVEMAEIIAEISHRLNKEICLIINRRGQIISISVGEFDRVNLENYKNTRESSFRLCGLRCIHTHPAGISSLSNADLTALSSYRFDAIACIAVDEEGKFSKKHGEKVKFADSIQTAYLTANQDQWHILEPVTLKKASEENFLEFLEVIEKEFSARKNKIEVATEEKAILVSLHTDDISESVAIESLEELKRLSDTAGAKIVGELSQKKHSPDNTTYLGSGKAKELSIFVQEKGANIVIVDTELSPRQQKNLEEIVKVKTIDRTELILDIFAQRARTKEGKLQVELAQLKYLFPRLIGAGLSLSRQGGAGAGGGIATRGPGETKLEIDRRRIKDRISFLEREVEEIKNTRTQQRKLREANHIPVVSIVGYTNAGKSTLLNALSNSDVLAENKLFATLDPTTRKVRLINGENILLTDTVGFIQRLPTALIKAFRATLEEITQSDVILHVIDPVHPNCEEHIKTVNQILEELDAFNKPVISVINKIDLVKDEEVLYNLNCTLKNPIAISALKRYKFNELLSKIQEIVNENTLQHQNF